MKTVLLYAVLSYLALYACVWLHEVGHSLLHWRFGCKDSWARVQVRPYIFFSTPGPVNVEAYSALTPGQRALSAYGGVLSNLFWAALGGALLGLAGPDRGCASFFLWMFVTLNLGEIVSYLLIGSVYLVSDMSIIAAEYPRLRIPNLLAGALLTAGYVWLLTRVPDSFRTFAAVWNIVTIICMCGGRIAFTALGKRNQAREDG